MCLTHESSKMLQKYQNSVSIRSKDNDVLYLFDSVTMTMSVTMSVTVTITQSWLSAMVSQSASTTVLT